MTVNRLDLEPQAWRGETVKIRTLDESDEMPRETSIWCNCCVYIRNTWEYLNYGDVRSLEHHFIEGREQGRPRAVTKIPTYFTTFFSLAPEIAVSPLKQQRVGDMFQGGWGTNVVAVVTGKNNPLTCPKERHAEFRRFFNKHFGFKNVVKHGPFLINHTENLFAHWNSRGQEFDLSGSLRQFSLESVCRYIGLKTPQNIQDNFDFMVNQSSKKGLKQTNFLLGLLFTVEEERLAEVIEALQSTVSQAYVSSQQEGASSPFEEEKTIIQHLKEATHRDGKAIFSEEEVFDTVRLLLLAGQDTTASLLLSLCYYLSQSSYWCEKIRDELENSSETDEVMRIYTCKRIKMVIAECLRLMPPTPFVGREGAVQDLVIERGGVKSIYIPKGSTVQVDNLFSSRDKERWGEDAEEFNPARQEAYYHLEKHKVETPFPNCTFGGPGRHHCIGEELALMVAAIFTAKLVYYDIKITSNKIKARNNLSYSFHSEDHPSGHVYAILQAKSQKEGACKEKLD